MKTKKTYLVSEIGNYTRNIASIIETFVADRYDLEYLFGKQVYRYGDVFDYRYKRADELNVSVLFDNKKGKLVQVQLSAVPIKASQLLKSPFDNIEDVKQRIASGMFKLNNLACYSCAKDAERVVLDNINLDTIVYVTFVKEY